MLFPPSVKDVVLFSWPMSVYFIPDIMSWRLENGFISRIRRNVGC